MNNFFKFFIIFLIWTIGNTTPLLSQINAIDSLKQLLSTVQIDTQRVDLLNKLGFAYHRENKDLFGEYTKEAIQLAESVDYKPGLSRGLTLLSIFHLFNGDKELALEKSQEALRIGEEISSPYHIAVAHNAMSVIYGQLSENTKVLDHYYKALPYAEESKDSFLLGVVVGNIGYLHIKEVS